MSEPIADQFDYIRQRLNEIQAEKEKQRSYPPVVIDPPEMDLNSVAEIWMYGRL